MTPKSPQFEILETQAFYAIWSESAVAILFTVRNVCFIKTDTLYIGGNLYKVYPFLWNRLYLKRIRYYFRALINSEKVHMEKNR